MHQDFDQMVKVSLTNAHWQSWLREARSIAMRRTELLDRIRSLQPKHTAEGVTHVALFGSRARGDDNTGSDVDLLVEVDPARRFSLLNLVGVEQIVEAATGITANAFMRRSLAADFRSSIARDVVDVF